MKTKLLSIITIFFPFITVAIGQYFTPAYLEFSDNPYQPMNFYITSATLDGTNLGISDEIGVFDGEVCVGSIVLESEISEYVQVLASAQDNDWETIAGFISGNSFNFLFWDFSEEIEIIDVTHTILDGNTSFQSFGVTSLTLAGATTSDDIYGCMDSFSCNFNPDATVDDGSCIVPDECGTCDGSILDLGCGCGEPAPDECGTCDGSILDLGCGCGEPAPDECGTCDGSIVDFGCGCGVPAPDCDGICGGEAVEDECGICDGDNSSCLDCAGIPNGDSLEDNCNTCDDDSSNDCLQDCAGTWGGNLEYDECGVCGGDNSSCTGCTDEFALNYDPNAIIPDGGCEYPIFGCMDGNALNFDPIATNSDGSCDYPPEVGLAFGDLIFDVEEGNLEIIISNNADLDEINFTLSGAAITGASGGLAEENSLEITTTTDSFTASGLLPTGYGLFTILTLTMLDTTFCLNNGNVSAPDYESSNLTLGGCTVMIGVNGGTVESETAGVDIPEGALDESENIALGDVTEELLEEVENATGFDFGELASFTPYDLEFDIPVVINLSSENQINSNRNEFLCFLTDENTTQWTVLYNASCSGGTCLLDAYNFGIYAVCELVEDCNGDLGGIAYIDLCGECVGGNTDNDALFTMDECGLCGGPGFIDWYIDSDGDDLGYGEGVQFCSDVVPEGYVPNNNDDEPDCFTNDTDECGLCGGDGPFEGYDCNGNCLTEYDCANVCGGNAVNDECGICNGDNSSCTDCNSEINGTAFIDGCGVCVGGNTGLGPCSEDCNGVYEGSSWVNNCGICVSAGDTSCIQGCDGIWTDNGSQAILDECGVCDGDNSTCSGCTDEEACNYFPDATLEDGSCENPLDPIFDCLGNCLIVVDCLGECGGNAEEDECGVCNGPGPVTWYEDVDSDGMGFGSGVAYCETPGVGWVQNNVDPYPNCAENYYDCFGDCGGTGVLDCASICGGDGEVLTYCEDTDGDLMGNPGTETDFCSAAVADYWISDCSDPEPDCITNDVIECGECGCSLNIENTIPNKFGINQIYPNPFNPVTTISYSIPRPDMVTLYIYDLNGKRVSNLLNENLNAGHYSVDWHALGESSGVYFVKLESGNIVEKQKIVLVK